MGTQATAASGQVADEDGSQPKDLYDYPEVYAALRAPEPGLMEGVRRVFARYARNEVRSVMDPACGPANWLEPFAREGVFTAGNDLSSRMVRAARVALNGFPNEITQGDMRSLRFQSGPFDAAIEIAGTASLLSTEADLLAHLRTVGAHLRTGGLFLVTLMFDFDGQRAPTPHLCYERGPITVGESGVASVTYHLMGWEQNPPAMVMRRVVRTEGVPGCPERIEDGYSLRVWREQDVRRIVVDSGMFAILSWEGLPVDDAEDHQGEQTLVLRRT